MDQDRLRNLANILQTYFSDASLRWDKIMQAKIAADPNGFVPFSSLVTLVRFKSAGAKADEIREAAELHPIDKLKLNDDKTAIARVKPFVVNKTEELDGWSIYVEGLQSPYNNQEKIAELFGQLVGRVSFVRIPVSQNGNYRFNGFCFVEFEDASHVAKAVSLVNQYLPDQPKEAIPIEADDKQKELVKKLNLRVISKETWNAYKDEYLKQFEIQKKITQQRWQEYAEKEKESGQAQEDRPAKKQKTQAQESNTKGVSYTPGVIAVVTNCHEKSPKSVVKQLLESSGAKIAFLNHKKGNPSCHVRVETPKDMDILVKYFEKEKRMQNDGQDTVGRIAGPQDPPSAIIGVRCITGKEEEIYWEQDQKRG